MDLKTVIEKKDEEIYALSMSWQRHRQIFLI